MLRKHCQGLSKLMKGELVWKNMKRSYKFFFIGPASKSGLRALGLGGRHGVWKVWGVGFTFRCEGFVFGG